MMGEKSWVSDSRHAVVGRARAQAGGSKSLLSLEAGRQSPLRTTDVSTVLLRFSGYPPAIPRVEDVITTRARRHEDPLHFLQEASPQETF